MHLIYLDESARGGDYYFFGALIVDAVALQSVEAGLNSITELVANNVNGFDQSTELHAVDIFHGKGAWKDVPIGWRVKVCHLVSKAVSRSGSRFIFRGMNVAAQRARYGPRAFPPHLLTLAHTLEEVDRHLALGAGEGEIGLAVADEHHSAPGARRSMRDFKIERVPGYTKGPLTQIVDTIYFGPSLESRLLQAADLATFFMNRYHTIIESDPRSEKAVRKIVARIRSITVDEYVWHP